MTPASKNSTDGGLLGIRFSVTVIDCKNDNSMSIAEEHKITYSQSFYANPDMPIVSTLLKNLPRNFPDSVIFLEKLIAKNFGEGIISYRLSRTAPVWR